MGLQGLQGTQGNPGVQGPAGLTPQGVYSGAATYALGDEVSYNGSSYISLQALNTGNQPDSFPLQWSVLAAKGVNFRQAYASGTTYAIGDAVSYTDGSSYISLIAGNVGNAPATSPADWSLLALAGINGTNGTPGTNGSPGTNGINGT